MADHKSQTERVGSMANHKSNTLHPERENRKSMLNGNS